MGRKIARRVKTYVHRVVREVNSIAGGTHGLTAASDGPHFVISC